VIVNPYSVLAAFVSVVEAVLGAAALCLALATLFARRADDARVESRRHLVILLAATALGLSAVGWPLFYLVLRSYVPRWPGVMCVQGVTRVGTGAIGATGRLPALVAALGALRPAAVFVAGAWVALHVANRRTRTAPLGRAVLVALAVAGAVALASGVAETAYLLIPKQERFLADGCCTMPSQWTTDGADVGPLVARFGEEGAVRAATTLFFVVGGALAATVAWIGLAPGDVLARRFPLGVATSLAAAFLVVAAMFATDAASPILLRLPHHRCGWCLAAAVPETLVGAGLVFLGAFACGWAALLAWCARTDDARAEIAGQTRALLRASLFGICGALLLAAVELATA